MLRNIEIITDLKYVAAFQIYANFLIERAEYVYSIEQDLSLSRTPLLMASPPIWHSGKTSV
jgi:hypothetical protein